MINIYLYSFLNLLFMNKISIYFFFFFKLHSFRILSIKSWNILYPLTELKKLQLYKFIQEVINLYVILYKLALVLSLQYNPHSIF